MSKFAWVTLTTNDTYSLGALVLANSLKRVGTAHQLAVLVTPNVSDTMKSKLKDAFNVVQEVDVLDSKDEANLALLARPELGITFTKLHCWRLVQFEKCVFLDADILVLQNSDELFEREELSAAPDVSWPDCFNSGVFVYRPNLETFNKLIEFAVKNGSFDGGDQGLLNQYFSDWATKDISKHLPFTYNTAAYAAYCYLPAFKQFRDRIKILHFAGKLKPWLATFDSQNRRAHTPQGYEHAADFIQLWWNIFCDQVHQSLHNSMIYSTSGRTYQENSYPIIISETINQNPILFHDPWEDYYEKLEKCNIYEKNLFENNFFNEKTIHNYLNTNTNSNNNNENITETEIKTNLINNEQLNNNNNNNNNNILLDCYTIENTNLETFEDNINLQNNSDKNISSDITFPNNNYKKNTNDNCNYKNIEEISEKISTPPPSPPLPSSYSQSIQNQQQYDLKMQLQTQNNNNNELISPNKATSESINFNNTQNFNNNNNDKRLNNNNEKNTNNINNNNENIDNNIEVNYYKNNSNDFSNNIENTKNIDEESGLAGVLSTLRLGEAKTPEQEAYEQAMRRQCWESGNIDYTGKDSFDNIWKKISQTIDGKPKSDNKQESASRLTSADIEDGKIEFDKKTGATILYKIIPGGWTKTITTQQPNGTKKSETKTFYDPVPVTDEEEIKKLQNRTDGKTTVEHRKIPGGREEIHTTVYPDGTSSTQIKTFYDSGVDVNENETTNRNTTKKNTTAVQKVKKQDSQDNQIQEIQQYNRRDSKNIARQEKNIVQQFSEETVEEHRRVTKVSGRQVTKTDSVEEQQHNVQAIQSKTGKKVKKTDSVEEYTVNDKKDVTKKKKRTAAPPPPTLPPEFADGKTTVTSKKINGGTEYTYTTVNKEGKTMISTKTVYEEEEVDMTEEEIKQYQKQLKEAKKHENLQTEKTLKTKDGSIKKVVPSENPGDVTTVEEKRIPGGTEYHYTTVTKEGIVKKSSKTIYDPVPVEKKNGDDTSEEEIIEEYEEEVIAPGEQVTKTIVKNVQMVKEEKRETFERITTGSVVVSDISEKKKGRKAIKN
ncbi:probable cyclin-dependent serine/threonine-protein kinase DDB_G0292550 isoform X2 [Condylostylus longicornis]|uniref:probable cyclin-dependent serine/threonine-protein kinase DDB_G0292550 isoform X2 n=1 Tax=Condylostylus longicornis TaxID=2530218 RepID=UPI00244DD947|nr:probable cyclin-dependent serine/threonine-protein kinase DDB_G0292550 isoform X2 [Condylostylus longicornis]